MSDYTSRKRLRKKVLDRWENEGGKLDEVPSEESSCRDREKELVPKKNTIRSNDSSQA